MTRRGWGILAGGLLGAVAIGAGGWLGLRPAVADPPGVTVEDADPAVVKVLAAARQEVRAAPRSAPAWGRLGMVLIAHGYRAESNVCFAQAERLDPREFRWPYFHGITLTQSDPDASIPKLQRALELHSEEVLTLRLAGVLLYQGRLDEAEAVFGRYHPTPGPGDDRAHLLLARLNAQRGEPRRSLHHLQYCTSSPYTRKAAHALRAQVSRRLGDTQAAEQDQRLAADLPDDRDWPDPYAGEVERLQVGRQVQLAAADQLLADGRVAEALAVLRQTAEAYPDSDRVWLTVGRAQLHQGNYRGADEALRRALRCNPGSVEAHFQRGVALFLLDQLAEAAACFRQTTDLKPAHALAHYNLGQCLRRQGDPAGAVQAFRATLVSKPGYAEAHRSLGEILAEQGDLAGALMHLRQALELKPNDELTKKLLAQLLGQALFSRTF